MNRTNTTFFQRHKAFLTAVLLNLCLLILSIVFCTMQFGTNDDRDISNLLANVYGNEWGEYIVFVNVILCRFLSFLYRVTGNVTNWYVLLSVLVSFVSLTAITYLLLRRAPKFRLGLILSLILLTRLYKSHYVIFQFTQNSALYAAAGVLLLADGFFHWDRGALVRSLLGVFLLVLGSMVRFQSIYFTLPYLAFFVGYEILFTKKDRPFFRWLAGKWKSIALLCLCPILILGVRFYHSHVFQSDPTLATFYEDNLLRAELLDYGFPSYEENAAALEALGIAESDMEMFSHQSFLDKSVFSQSVLQAMVDMKGGQATSYSLENLKLSSIPSVIDYIVTDMTGSPFWWIILALCLYFFLCTDRRGFGILLASLFFTLGILWYFLSVNRLPYRVWYAITAPLLIALLYLCAKNGPPATARRGFSRGVRKCMGYALYAICLALILLTGRQFLLDRSVVVSDTYEQIVAFAEEHPDDLVLLDRPTVSPLTYASTVSPLTALPSGSHQNICYQGGWICWTPANLATLERFDTKNVYESIANGMEVYLIDGETCYEKLRFIRRHYNNSVRLALISYIGDTKIGIYRFYVP